MKNDSMNNWITILASAAFMLLAACSTTPERIDALERARETVQQLEHESMAQAEAPEHLSKARDALARADAAQENGEPIESIRHEAFVARTNAEIGLEQVAEAKSLARIDHAKAERQRVLLESRTVAAERAEARAKQQTAEAKQSRQAAKTSRAAAEETASENERLQEELAALHAKQTDRGLVLTLSDVLFATDGAELAAGSELAMNRLADFLRDHPDRKLRIEGHTDSRGSEAYNEALSNRRADSVAEALVQRGIASTRVQPVGMGEAYPVAPNETTAGRQQNRRVEIVVSDQDGTFPAAVQRSALRK